MPAGPGVVESGAAGEQATIEQPGHQGHHAHVALAGTDPARVVTALHLTGPGTAALF